MERINKFLNAEELDENAISHEPTADPLIMENATFFWNQAEGHPILKNLNLKINKRSLVAVIGPVGAGKSSMISAFLGEMYKTTGIVNTKGTIAYVPQQAWILNATLKQNITLNEPVNSDLYKNAIEACALQSDLENLPGGDLTEIGEKGVNLSGGQKQRVSLARAVCRDADIYFFDDPLSAVDSHVANHIFHRVLGPDGILNKKTRILVTHNNTFFSLMDQIIVLMDGKIVEKGKYEELCMRSHYLIQLSNLDEKNQSIINNNIHEEGKKNNENSILENPNLSTAEIVSRYRKKGTKPFSSQLIEEEHAESKQPTMKLYWSYISAAGVFLTAATFLLLITYQTTSIFSNIWLSSWIATSNDSANRYYYLIVYASYGVGQALTNFFGNIALFFGAITASAYFYEKLLENVLRWPMNSFDSTPIGRLIGRFIDDVYILDNTIGSKIAMSISSIVRYTSIMVLITWIIPVSIFITVPFLILFFTIKNFYVSLSKRLSRIESMNRSSLYSHIIESISGVQSIRAYGFQKQFSSRCEEKCDKCSAAYYSSAVCLRWVGTRCELLGALFISFTTILCILQDSLSIDQLALLMTYLLQMARGLGSTVLYICEVENRIISVERINEYITYPQESSWEKSSIKVHEEWPNNGEVIFHNYQLRYRNDLDLVLKGLSFKIQGGEKVGIVGRTGAGKTSIISGLFRIVEPTNGTIFVDNVDITALGLHKLRSKHTVIPQDPVLFSGTLRFNLDPFNNYTDEHLWHILEKSHLKIFVQSLPGCLLHNIEEGGRNISFGQKQLICLARALLCKNKILVMDEATASVDMKTDELIQKTIRDEFSNSTVITIAHRLTTLQDYDKILILDDGRIVDFDTTENLLNLKNSRLRDMMQEI